MSSPLGLNEEEESQLEAGKGRRESQLSPWGAEASGLKSREGAFVALSLLCFTGAAVFTNGRQDHPPAKR